MMSKRQEIKFQYKTSDKVLRVDSSVLHLGPTCLDPDVFNVLEPKLPGKSSKRNI